MKSNNVPGQPALAAVLQSPVSRLAACRGPVIAICLMLLAVVVIYWPPPAQPDSVLIGSDYLQLHSRRMQFARDALFSEPHLLPAWYPRELLGTPFWSNIQNFPFIPTRLLVLLTMDPNGPYTYAFAITLSATLAALFTFLYLRKLGLGLTSSATAGWTFACSGYYASRVTAGHLPLLEAYPALPLLLWSIESLLQAPERNESLRRWIFATAVSSTCVILAGHPQLPVYSLSVASLYALWRGRLSRAIWGWGAMAIGVGIAAFALVPMGMLISRSTRILALAPPLNDLSMPYARLVAFFFPWRDGAPPLLDPGGSNPFHGYPSMTYFWDTVGYVGLLPWIAVLALCCLRAKNKFNTSERRLVVFVLAMGVAGIALSLPLVHQVTSLIPGTILRSPARIIFLTEFALAIALGIAVQSAVSMAPTSITRVVMAILLTLHIVDLGGFDRQFILLGSLSIPPAESAVFAKAFSDVRDGRVAIDYELILPENRTMDDVGFFDSIMLAGPYRSILSLSGAPEDLNIQTFNGSQMSVRALAATGVKVVVTTTKREDLQSEDSVHAMRIYRVPSPSRRAEFFDSDHVRYLPVDEIHAMLRDPAIDLQSMLLLPREAPAVASKTTETGSNEVATVEYRRPDSDHIECLVTTGRDGYLRIIESWDPGWSVMVDGSPARIVPALDSLLAVPLAPGRHEVRFVFRTRGAAMGLMVSVVSLLLLGALMCLSSSPRRQRRP
jgi:Bacterial membrane protein YfhO